MLTTHTGMWHIPVPVIKGIFYLSISLLLLLLFLPSLVISFSHWFIVSLPK